MNNFLITCSDIKNNHNLKLSVKYYFETLEDAKKAKESIEKGGNIAKIKKVR